MAKKMEAHLHEEFKLWSFVVLCQSKSRMQGGKKEKSNIKKFKRIATVGHIQSTSQSPFNTYYISFRNSGSQESNSSNSVQIGAETKKLWSFEDNRAKLSENFAAQSPFCNCEMSCEMKSTCEISQGVLQLRNHLQAHVCHFASCNSIFTAVNHVAKSPPSCEITLQIISKLRNHKFNLQSQSSNLQNGQFNLQNPTV